MNNSLLLFTVQHLYIFQKIEEKLFWVNKTINEASAINSLMNMSHTLYFIKKSSVSRGLKVCSYQSFFKSCVSITVPNLKKTKEHIPSNTGFRRTQGCMDTQTNNPELGVRKRLINQHMHQQYVFCKNWIL